MASNPYNPPTVSHHHTVVVQQPVVVNQPVVRSVRWYTMYMYIHYRVYMYKMYLHGLYGLRMTGTAIDKVFVLYKNV